MKKSAEYYGLPSRVEVSKDKFYGEDDFELEEEINEYLSNTYGFLIYDYIYYFENDLLIVEDIIWDTYTEEDDE